MKLQPLLDRIILKKEQTSENYKSGIIIPDSAIEKPLIATVIAVGDGVTQNVCKITNKFIACIVTIIVVCEF